MHSSLSRMLHSLPSHQVFRIYLTPSLSVTDSAPSLVASSLSAEIFPQASRCLSTCSCRRSCSSRPVYSLKIRQPCCVSHRIAPLFGYAIPLSHTAPAVPPLCHSLTTPPKDMYLTGLTVPTLSYERSYKSMLTLCLLPVRPPFPAAVLWYSAPGALRPVPTASAAYRPAPCRASFP